MTQTPLMLIVFKRLKAEGIWAIAEPVRDELTRQSRQHGLKKEAAGNWVYRMLAKQFPPQGNAEPEGAEFDPLLAQVAKKVRDAGKATAIQPSQSTSNGPVAPPKPARDPVVQPKPIPSSDDGFSVTGLGDFPANWPDLPSNAPLAVEVSWVQANRLRCVREVGDRVMVDLSRALGPAPSYAALGWLETSIKTYSKFVDVAARATAGTENEAAAVKREIASIEEVRKILASMLEAEPS